MSPFIDSMVTAEDSERLQSHVAACAPCRRMLQSYISVRNLIARIESPAVPEDMVLETRVRLSRARNDNFLVRFENRLNNVLKPLVVPVLLGVSVTMLLFGVLLGSLASNSTVLAQNRFEEPPVYRLFQPVRTENPDRSSQGIWIRIASNDKQDFDLTIETHVGYEGRVIDYQILSGPKDPKVDSWIRQVLSLAQFTPATAFGKPVESRMIMSFIAVRN
jgi:hypothetical protein